MDAIEEIERARSADLVDEDGNPVVLKLEPAAPDGLAEELEAELGVELPRELRALLAHAQGIDGVLDRIDFTGRSVSFEHTDIFPAGLPFAHDGFGNHWVLDLVPGERDFAPVFFACHDPPVILYQGPSIAHFLHEAFRMCVAPHDSLVDDVHEDRLFDVWGSNPGVIDHAAALASGDEALRDFAAKLDDRFAIVDLRAPQIGMGFSWGRYGPRTEIRRYGRERLFACARPPKKTGRLRRLLGTR